MSGLNSSWLEEQCSKATIQAHFDGISLYVFNGIILFILQSNFQERSIRIIEMLLSRLYQMQIKERASSFLHSGRTYGQNLTKISLQYLDRDPSQVGIRISNVSGVRICPQESLTFEIPNALPEAQKQPTQAPMHHLQRPWHLFVNFVRQTQRVRKWKVLP